MEAKNESTFLPRKTTNAFRIASESKKFRKIKMVMLDFFNNDQFVTKTEVWGSNMGPVKSDSVLPTIQLRCDTSLKEAMLNRTE